MEGGVYVQSVHGGSFGPHQTMRLNEFVLVEVCTAKDVEFLLAHSVEGQAFSPQMIGNKGVKK
jgi:hypothetical protein